MQENLGRNGRTIARKAEVVREGFRLDLLLKTARPLAQLTIISCCPYP